MSYDMYEIPDEYKFQVLYRRKGDTRGKRALEVARYIKHKLESKQQGPGYVADDDALPGQDIFQAVERATEHSKFTICILTDGWNDFDDHLQKMVFHQIHQVEKRQKSFIVISMLTDPEKKKVMKERCQNISGVIQTVDVKYADYKKESRWLEKVIKSVQLGIGIQEVEGTDMRQPVQCSDGSYRQGQPSSQLEYGSVSQLSLQSQPSVPMSVRDIHDVDDHDDVDFDGVRSIMPSASGAANRSDDPDETHVKQRADGDTPDAWDDEDEEQAPVDAEDTLEGFMKATSFIGQEQAIRTVSEALATRDCGWEDEHPLVMLFLGPSGVGKTEMAKQMALYLKKDCPGVIMEELFRFDMSEFSHQHEVSKFIGAPPGYEGHSEGSNLFTKLDERPDAMVLLDEADKAHPDIWNFMLPLFDEGRLTNNKGDTIVCNSAIFILTANLANSEIIKYGMQRAANSPHDLAGAIGNMHLDDMQDIQKFTDKYIQPILKEHFKRDELLGRISETVCFMPFSRHECLLLVKKELEEIKAKAAEKKMSLDWSLDVVEMLANAYDASTGVRSIQTEVNRLIRKKLAIAKKKKVPTATLR